MSSQLDNAKNEFRRKFSDFLAEKMHGEIAGLLGEIQRHNWEAYFFGGIPRGAMTDKKYQPRDYDIVFSDADFESFADYAKSIGGRKNRFGGFKLNVNGAIVDAWALSETWAFKEKHVDQISFENLQKTVPFNVDSFLIEIFPSCEHSVRNVFCDGYWEAVQKNTLDVILKDNPYPELCLVRAVQFSHKMNLKWSRSLMEWMRDVLENSSLDDLIFIQESHYGHVYYNNDYWYCLRRELLGVHGLGCFSPPGNYR